MNEAIEAVRRRFAEKDDERDAGASISEDIKIHADILYGEDEKWQVLDVYRPDDMEGEVLPVIVSVHGGAWVYGDKERYRFYCMELAKRGFAVVNFTYRLAPEFKFPSFLEDTNLVMKWLLANCELYGMDPDNIFAVGDSAGANILGLYCDFITNKAYAERFDFKPPEGLRFNAIALNCGQYHIDLAGASDEARALIEAILPEGGTWDEQQLVSVDTNMTSDFPPTFFMTAPRDFLLPQAQVMQMALVINQIEFNYRFYCDEKSSLGHVFNLNVRSEWAAKCNDEECDFFRKHIV